MKFLNLQEPATMRKIANILNTQMLNIATAFMITSIIGTFIYKVVFFRNPLSAAQITEFISEKDSVCRRSKIETLLSQNHPIRLIDRNSLSAGCENSLATIEQVKEQLKVIETLPLAGH